MSSHAGIAELRKHRLLAHGFCSCSQWFSEELSREKIRTGHEAHLIDVLYAIGFRERSVL